MLRVSEWSVFIFAFTLWVVLCAATGQEISGNNKAEHKIAGSSPCSE
jgi:hypothetical protein